MALKLKSEPPRKVKSLFIFDTPNHPKASNSSSICSNFRQKKRNWKRKVVSVCRFPETRTAQKNLGNAKTSLCSSMDKSTVLKWRRWHKKLVLTMTGHFFESFHQTLTLAKIFDERKRSFRVKLNRTDRSRFRRNFAKNWCKKIWEVVPRYLTSLPSWRDWQVGLFG